MGFINELIKLNPKVKIIYNDDLADGHRVILSSVPIENLILPAGFYYDGNVIVSKDDNKEALTYEVKLLKLPDGDKLIDNVDESIINKDKIFSKNSINTKLYNYLNNINHNNSLLFDAKASACVLTSLYALFLKLIKLCGNEIDFNLLRKLEDQIYTIDGVRLDDIYCIKYELSRLNKNVASDPRFKNDVEILIGEIEQLLERYDDAENLMKIKKDLVILQILLGKKVTFFEAACKLLYEYCGVMEFGNNNKNL